MPGAEMGESCWGAGTPLEVEAAVELGGQILIGSATRERTGQGRLSGHEVTCRLSRGGSRASLPVRRALPWALGSDGYPCATSLLSRLGNTPPRV